MTEPNICAICHLDLDEDTCLVDCTAMHLFHYQCLTESVRKYKKICPMDRQNITKCVHDGEIKILPGSPPQERLLQEMQEEEEQEEEDESFEETPCYICHKSTRDGLEFDQIVECSGCEEIYCHSECEERVTGRRFDYSFHWYCPPCKSQRTLQRQTRQTTNAMRLRPRNQ